MCEISKTYKIYRRVYQSLFIDIADIFIEYIHSLDLDQIQQMDDDIKITVGGRGGVESLLKNENATIFGYFSNVPSFQHPASTNKWTFSCT